MEAPEARAEGLLDALRLLPPRQEGGVYQAAYEEGKALLGQRLDEQRRALMMSGLLPPASSSAQGQALLRQTCALAQQRPDLGPRLWQVVRELTHCQKEP